MTGIVIGKDQCPECAKNGRDTSKDNLALYDDGGRHCFSCGYTILSEAYKRENGLIREQEEEYSFIGMREFTKEDHELFKKNTTIKAYGYRGIRDEIYAKFGVRHAYNTEGEVSLIAQYYPITKDWQFCGYKKRTLPKSFTDGHLGHFGSDCDLFGQFRFKNPNSKICVIVGGEIDQLSAYQMLWDDAQVRGKDYEPVVVSPVVGEVSTATQIKKHYNWFDKFERIYLCFDNDDAGRKATDRAAKALPKDKVYVVPMSLKDPNEYLKDGKEALWINEFFKATHYVPVGVAGSDQLYNGILDNALTPKIPLPEFMHEITKALAGGIPGSGKIINLGAACVDADTEFLTPVGWKKISEYSGEMVGQYNPKNNKLEFVKAEYIKQPCNEKMYHISTLKGVDMVLTENHRFAYWDRWKREDSSKISTLPVKKLVERHYKTKSGFKESIKTCFDFDGEGIDFNEGELRLQVAVMADGRIVREGKDNYTQMRFKKERKYKRLLFLCEYFNLRFDDRGVNSEGYYEVIVWPKTDDKYFSSYFWKATKEQMLWILDELLHWDGYLKNRQYSTTIKSNADFIQFAYNSTGQRATISIDNRVEKYSQGCSYTVYAPSNSFVSLGGGGSGSKATIEQFIPRDGMKYCFSVPSTFLVLRRNNNVFITGNSGAGKTSWINEIIYHWLFFCTYKVGIVSMELDKAEYGEVLLSRHIGRKLALIEKPQDKLDFLKREDIRDKANNLFLNENGIPRFYLVDDRDGTLKQLQRTVEELIISFDCKVIVLDPIQDLLDGMSNEDQAVFMKWQKSWKKSHGVTFFNINHLRKSNSTDGAGSTGAFITEEDFAGSSTIFKSADLNILIMRDKYHDDLIMRNTTRVTISKCRWTGFTGPVGEYYYDNETHTLWDKQDWINKFHPEFNNEE